MYPHPVNPSTHVSSHCESIYPCSDRYMHLRFFHPSSHSSVRSVYLCIPLPHLYIHPKIHLSFSFIHPAHPPFCPPTSLPVHPFLFSPRIHLLIDPSISTSVHLSTNPRFCSSIHPSIHPTLLFIYPSTYLFTHTPTHLHPLSYIYPSIHLILSIHPSSIYLPIHPLTYRPI